MNFRIFYATDQKTNEYFRTHPNKILNRLRGKSSSGLISVVQSFTPNGSENPCVAGSIPVLAKQTQAFAWVFFWPEKKANCLAFLGIEAKGSARSRLSGRDESKAIARQKGLQFWLYDEFGWYSSKKKL